MAEQMFDKGQQSWAKSMIVELDAMLVLSDKEYDTLLTAKVEEVRMAVIEKYLPPAD